MATYRNLPGAAWRVTDVRPGCGAARVCGRIGLRLMTWVFIAVLAGPAVAQPSTATSRPVAAQPRPAPPELDRWRTLIGADEQTLWVVHVDRQKRKPESVVFRRAVNGGFEAQPGLNAAIAEVRSARGTLYAFCEDGSFYSLIDEQWTRELDLPARAQPVDLTAGETLLYALVPSQVAAGLPPIVEGQRAPDSQPFEPGTAPLSVLRYDNQGWAGLVACPPVVDPPNSARLGWLGGAVAVFWHGPAERVRYVRYDVTAGLWSAPATAPTGESVTEFWVTEVRRLPTVLCASPAAEGLPHIGVVRLIGTPGTTGHWQPVPYQFSALPADVGDGHYREALGFNQHAVLLLEAAGGAYLQFGYDEGAPAEATVSVNELLARESGPAPAARWVQYLTPVVIAVVLAALFLLRRSALRAPVVLPDEYALGLAFQRLGGFVIDIGPIGLVVAVLLGVNWQTSLRELSGWALGADPSALPATRSLMWWVASVATYTLYSFFMELLTGRTIGKLTVGTRVLSERGTPPGRLQILIRNALRLLELLPPLWVLAFLVVLSQNRQRLGDIFARTVVARRVRRAEN